SSARWHGPVSPSTHSTSPAQHERASRTGYPGAQRAGPERPGPQGRERKDMSRAALRHHYTGKIRDLYEVDHDRMLIVASDRISVFGVVLPDEIPDKGRVLTGLSTFWFEQTAHLWPNHVVSSDPTDLPETAGPDIAGRAMLVRATRPVRLRRIAPGHLFRAPRNVDPARRTVFA